MQKARVEQVAEREKKVGIAGKLALKKPKVHLNLMQQERTKIKMAAPNLHQTTKVRIKCYFQRNVFQSA